MSCFSAIRRLEASKASLAFPPYTSRRISYNTPLHLRLIVTIYSIPTLALFLDIPMDGVCFLTTIVIIFAHSALSLRLSVSPVPRSISTVGENYFKLAAYLILMIILSSIVYSKYCASSLSLSFKFTVTAYLLTIRLPKIIHFITLTTPGALYNVWIIVLSWPWANNDNTAFFASHLPLAFVVALPKY